MKMPIPPSLCSAPSALAMFPRGPCAIVLFPEPGAAFGRKARKERGKSWDFL